MLMVLVTPITADEVDLRFAFTHIKCPKDSAQYKIARRTIETVSGPRGVVGDIPIWQHKKYLEYPLLCDGDGPIMRFRKYFSQFYQGGMKEVQSAQR